MYFELILINMENRLFKVKNTVILFLLLVTSFLVFPFPVAKVVYYVFNLVLGVGKCPITIPLQSIVKIS